MKNKLLLIKSIVYRIVRISIVLVVSLILTGNISESLAITFFDAIIATAFYYYFDASWDKFLSPFFEKIILKYKYRKFEE